MPTPSHVRAFQFISDGTTNEIRDYIAFGIFMEAEASWAATKGDLSEAQYRRYHDHLFIPFERNRLRRDADQALARFAAQAVDARSAELLRHHRRFRWKGVLEGILGAAGWTIFLVVATILAQRARIDILEIYKRAAGVS